MVSKVWTFVNWGVLAVVTLAAIWMVWDLPKNVDDENISFNISIPSGECVDVVAEDEFEFEACYDASSESIFLKTIRGKAAYKISQLSVSFVDLSSQSYDLEDVPEAGSNKAYKILAKKNPGSVDVRLGVVKDFSGFVCGGKSVFVDYCPAGTGGEGVGVSISPIEGVSIKDFIEVEDLPDFDSDIVVMDLVEKEAIWESTCKSNWDCGEWEICSEGVQRRSCNDLSNCAISTDSPISAQRCDGACVENWECEWSGCESGFSVPKCKDLNGCGTSFGVPEKLSCDKGGKCSPDVSCSDWAKCDVDYDFVDLIGSDKIIDLEGSMSRVCVDKKGCVATSKEEKACSVSVDIYTKRFERCGDSYIGIYDVLNDETLAVLKDGGGSEFYLNIYFDEASGVYCDYCFDGVMNGDEVDVDCGGSCRECQEEVVVKKKWWQSIF